MSYSSMNPMYRGLLDVFRKRHIPDSIAKYSLLYCQVNDSSIALKDQQLTAQMAASYDYHYYKEKALFNEKEAYKNWLLSIILLVSLSIVIGIGLFALHNYKKRHEAKRKKLQQEFAKRETRLKAEFAEAKENLDADKYILFRSNLAAEAAKHSKMERYFRYEVSKFVTKNMQFYRTISERHGDNFAYVLMFTLREMTIVDEYYKF